MASTYKTTNLKLPQWELSDKPQMADFNDAFEKIDQYSSGLIQTGTWKPVLTGSTQASELVYQTQYGHYIRIGNFVHLDYTVKISDVINVGKGEMIVTNLPFKAKEPSSGVIAYLNGGNNDYIRSLISGNVAGKDMYLRSLTISNNMGRLISSNIETAFANGAKTAQINASATYITE